MSGGAKLIVATLLIAGVAIFAIFVFQKISGALDSEQSNVWLIQILPFAVMGVLLIFILLQKRQS